MACDNVTDMMQLPLPSLQIRVPVYSDACHAVKHALLCAVHARRLHCIPLQVGPPRLPHLAMQSIKLT